MPSSISNLPPEVLLQVRSYLDCRGFRNFRLASRQLEDGTLPDLVKRGPYKVYVPFTRQGLEVLNRLLDDETFVSNTGTIIIDLNVNRLFEPDSGNFEVEFLLNKIHSVYGPNHQIDIGIRDDRGYRLTVWVIRRYLIGVISRSGRAVRHMILERSTELHLHNMFMENDIFCLSKSHTVELLHKSASPARDVSIIWQKDLGRLSIARAHRSWLVAVAAWLETIKIKELRISDSSLGTSDVLRLTADATSIALLNVTVWSLEYHYLDYSKRSFLRRVLTRPEEGVLSPEEMIQVCRFWRPEKHEASENEHVVFRDFKANSEQELQDGLQNAALDRLGDKLKHL